MKERQDKFNIKQAPCTTNTKEEINKENNIVNKTKEYSYWIIIPFGLWCFTGAISNISALAVISAMDFHYYITTTLIISIIKVISLFLILMKMKTGYIILSVISVTLLLFNIVAFSINPDYSDVITDDIIKNIASFAIITLMLMKIKCKGKTALDVLFEK